MKLLLFFTTLLLSSSVFSSSFYIQNNKVFNSKESVNFLLYNYYQKNNIKDFIFSLYRVDDVKSFFQDKAMSHYNLKFSDSTIRSMDLIKTWTEKKLLNYRTEIEVGTLPQGVYLVDVLSGGEIAQIPIVVSDYAVITRSTKKETLIYMTNSISGKQERAFKAFMQVQTSTISPLYYKNACAYFIRNESNSSGNFPVIAYKGEHVAINQAYFYNYYYDTQANEDIVAYINTDRSGYRPEQTIKFKGTLRKKNGFGYDILTDSIVYYIQNEQNEEVFKKRVALNKMGSFNDSVVADKSWKLGTYKLLFSLNARNKYWYNYNNTNNQCIFKIEEYKKPEYEVIVNIDKNQYALGETLKAKIEAKYFFGAPVTNAAVEYKIVAEEFYIPWYYNSYYWSWYQDMYGSSYNSRNKTILYTGKGSISDDGSFEFDFQTPMDKKRNFKYTVIAEIKDASRRTITGTAQTIVSFNRYTISANFQKYYHSIDEKPRLTISAFDFSKNHVSEDINISIEPYTTKAHSLFDTIITTASDKSLELSIPKLAEGYYKVILKSNTSEDNPVKSELYLRIIDKVNWSYNWWGDGNNIEIMTDKKIYKSGDVIDVMCYVPDDIDALITLDGKSFAHFDNYSFTKTSEGAKKAFQIPLQEDINGRLRLNVEYFKEGVYHYKSHDISVLPNNKMLDVSLTFNQSEYKPGHTATATLKVTDNQGKPVRNADISLATADEAIYALYPDQNKSLSDVFYNTKPSYKYSARQNFFQKSKNSAKIGLDQMEWRRKTLDLSITDLNLLPQHNNYDLFFHRSNVTKPKIIGYILDNKTGQALSGVTVVVNNKETIKLKGSGFFSLEGFKYNKVDLLFKYNGSSLELKNVELEQNQNTNLVVGISLGKNKSIDANHNNSPLQSILLSKSDDLIEVKESNSIHDYNKNRFGDNEYGLVGNDTGLYFNANKKYIVNKEEAPTNDLIEPTKIRSDFRDAIYWQPNLRTNAKGEVTVKIKLPDNLTTWRTIAKVITSDTKVGQTMAKIIVTKDLLVRMETPRFMTLGDEMLIATTIHNYLDANKKVTVELQSKGLSIEGTRKTIFIEPNGDKRIDWHVNTKFITEAELTVKALTNEESDAMTIKLPVKPYGLEMYESKSLYMVDNKTDQISLNIPDDINMNSAVLEINTAPSVTAALLSSLDDLIGYPYGCVEQTMSRFLPNIIVAQTLQNIGKNLNSTIDMTELEKMVNQGTKRLGELQHKDGSWGWWENDQTNGFMTAYVVNGLYMAQQQDYAIPSQMFVKGKKALRTIITSKNYDSPTTYAYAMMVAAKCGMEDLWKTYKSPDSSNAYELALWTQAAYFAGDKTAAQNFVKRLEQSVIKAGSSNYWSGKKFYYNWQDDKVETTANAVLALSLVDENHPLIAGAVLWLMSQKKGNSWHNTRQTAMTIFGLSNIIKRDINPNLTLEIKVNNQVVDLSFYSSTDVFQKGKTYTISRQELITSVGNSKTGKLNLLERGKNTIKVIQKGKGSLFVNAKLKYFINGDSPQAEIEKKHMPFDIERVYYKLKGIQKKNKFVYVKEQIDFKNIKSGDNLLVKVNIKSKNAQEYVLVEDPIPSGCEFIRDTKGFTIVGESVYDGTNQYWNYNYWRYWNWNRWYSHREYRDDRLSHTITNLPAGKYEYSYLIKAQIPGKYNVNPVIAQLMYYPEHRGFSEFGVVKISENKVN